MQAFFLSFCLIPLFLFSKVTLGIEAFIEEGHIRKYAGKKAGLVTNHTGIDSSLKTTLSLLDEAPKGPKIERIFFPEHGMAGAHWAEEIIQDQKIKHRPCYSLHGATRRPDKSMLEGLDIILFDIQDIGARSYTYISTLFYVMEEAKKLNIEVIVLDRPNPMGGLCVDGPLLDMKYRSFIGYVNVPYCHGMTVGELAKWFNHETRLGCALQVIKMKGWKREMTFQETGLPWVPTSPYIPEADTPFYYATTGLLGSLHLVNIGIGYTLPFKVVGAPYIHKEKLAQALDELNLPGVKFLPFSYKPFYGRFKGEVCHGIKIMIKDPKTYLPIRTGFALLGLLKSLYPKQFDEAIGHLPTQEAESFMKACGNADVLECIKKEKFPMWKLLSIYEKDKQAFVEKRTAFLLY